MSRKIVVVALLLPLMLGFVFAWTSVIHWGFNGLLRAKEWVSPDGRLSLQSQLPDMSSAWDCWPTASPIRPREHSLCELTLNRYQWDHPSMERISLSAMVDETDGGAYRIGVERGGTGIHRPILFCFEDTSPGKATCPLKIDPTGAYVLGANGHYRQLGAP